MDVQILDLPLGTQIKLLLFKLQSIMKVYNMFCCRYNHKALSSKEPQEKPISNILNRIDKALTWLF